MTQTTVTKIYSDTNNPLPILSWKTSISDNFCYGPQMEMLQKWKLMEMVYSTCWPIPEGDWDFTFSKILSFTIYFLVF